MTLLRDSRMIALALACVCLCAGNGLADDKDKKEKDSKAMQALAAPRAAGAKKKPTKVEKKPAAAAAPGQLNVVAAQQAQQDALTQQFQAQFRPILVAELSFIRHLCEVPKDKRPRVKAAGESGLKDAAKQYAALQQGRGRVGAGNANTQPYPPKTIHDALVEALKEALPRDEFARYMDETTKRAESRKRAAVLSVVSRLDGTLFLTAERREELAASIASNWQDKWEQWLMAGYGDQYFPMIPDTAVVPYLNEEQKAVWQGVQKVDFGFNQGGWAAAGQDDGYWGDNPDQAAAPAVDGLFIGDAIAAPNQ